VAAIAGWTTGLWLVAGGLSVVLGIWPDVGALYFHRFWEIEDQMQKMTHPAAAVLPQRHRAGDHADPVWNLHRVRA
jgi:hypothetical protein